MWAADQEALQTADTQPGRRRSARDRPGDLLDVQGELLDGAVLGLGQTVVIVLARVSGERVRGDSA
jgi:hypothetical protein